MNQAKEVKIPLALLGAAVLLYAGNGFYAAGAEGVGLVLTGVGIELAVGIPLGVIGCFITAKLMGISFGPLHTAILKLAAIFAFPAAVSAYIPFVGWLVAFVLYFGLLSWLFELEGTEGIVCAIVIWLVRFVAGMLAVFVIAGMA